MTACLQENLDYKESKSDYYFSLQLQANSYILWKRYTIKTNFDENYKAVQYEVLARGLYGNEIYIWR